MATVRSTVSAQMAGLGLLSVLSTSTAMAQTTTAPPAKPPTYNEQIEVVATRVPELPHEVPASIEVISGSQMRAMGATNLREALSLAAGVEVAPGGDAGPAGSVPEFWGLREFDAFLLVVDGIPWGGAFNPALTTLSLRDVERVEVLRGPAPVTYGATSFVGVIHVVHRNGTAANSYGAAWGGSFKTGGGAVDLSIPEFASWKSRLSASVDRRGFSDPRTSFTRGDVNYRGDHGEIGNRMWFAADVNWLRQDPASPHPREGASLSTAVPIDANYNPADAFLDDTRVTGTFGPNARSATGCSGT